MPHVALVEFPADDSDRARRFWAGLLGAEPEPRGPGEGEGWTIAVGDDETGDGPAGAVIGIHGRGRGPGDSGSLPYIEVEEMDAATARVTDRGGAIIHAGERWTICKDSEGNPFALAAAG